MDQRPSPVVVEGSASRSAADQPVSRMMDQQDQSHHDRSRDGRSDGDQSRGGQRDEPRADRMSDAFKHRFQAALGDAYALDRELSGGGMSRVFLGRDLMLGR